MPFKSKKQRRWMHANKPAMAKKWEQESTKGKTNGSKKAGIQGTARRITRSKTRSA